MRGLNRRGARWLWRLVALAAALLFVVSASAAQFGQRGGGRPGGGGRGGRGGDGGGRGDLTPNGLWNRYVTMQDFDGSFRFCRLQFRNGTNGDGGGWGVDWPR